MKYFVSVLLISLVVLFWSCSEERVAKISEEQKQVMRTTAVGFMKELKGVLINQIQTNGVVKAVSVCSDTAQVLTNKFGVEKGIYIKRVSFKNRNPNNFPDDFEKRILNQFELLHKNNELNDETEYAEIITEKDFKYLRYLKPILIQAECLNCHGSETEILPEVKDLIALEYPDDKAIGYSMGELRGAVSVKKIVE